MFKTLRTQATVAVALVMAAALAPATSMAREGATPVGHGLKCYTAAVPQADGTVKYQQVCYKGV